MRRSEEEVQADLHSLARLLRRPMTVDGLMAELGCSRRTLYRWMDQLIAQGYQVERVGIARPARYCIPREAAR